MVRGDPRVYVCTMEFLFIDPVQIETETEPDLGSHMIKSLAVAEKEKHSSCKAA